MFSGDTEVLSVAAKQYHYKLKSHMGFVLGFVVTQIIALLSGVSGSGMSSGGNVSVTVANYSSDASFLYTCGWIFVLAITLTGMQEEKKDFILVANRASNHLANIGILLTAWLYGGAASTLFAGLQRLFLYVSSGKGEVIANGFYLTGRNFGLTLAASLLYLLLLTAGSYLIGVLVRISRLYVIILAAAVFGLLRMNGSMFAAIAGFFGAEHSLPVFALKVLMVSLVLFGFSAVISSRLEVKG